LLLDLTLPTLAENLALDEALLLAAESAEQPTEVLRLWQPRERFVVVGRSSRVADEVELPECRRRRTPVLRRCSGGGAVVAGPGCLMYALTLSLRRRPRLQMIDQAHRFVLQTTAALLRNDLPGVKPAGTSDLALGDRKFSGNSLRVKRDHLLYHGTLLFDFPLACAAALLKHPPREPGYRQGRSHKEFLTNVPLTESQLRAALVAAWSAEVPLDPWPRELVARLVAEKYARQAWNFRR